MLLSKQESNIDLFFTRGHHNNIDIYYVSQSHFHLPKNTIRNSSNIIILFKQTLRDIILLFHDLAGLDIPVTKSLENTCQDITKTITESSIKNNQAIENLDNELLEIMNDRGILASYLMSPLSKITNPENTSQFKLVKDPSSNRVIDLKIHNSIPITLYGNILTFRDTGKKIELTDLLEMITNSKYNVNLASLADKKLMYDFAEEMNFDLKAVGKKSTRDRTLIKLLNSPGLMVSASGVSKTIFLSSDPNDLCDR